MSSQLIKIRGLKIATRIGVPAEERSEFQQIRVNVDMTPDQSFGAMADQIEQTIDYHAVCLELEALAGKGERQLIETLADEMAEHVLGQHHATEVRVEIEKFILPQTDWVGVEVVKSR
ncbi:MAG: dihydroneopterin aldolase [Haloferula sp.]